MDTHLATMTADKYVTVDGLRLRYIEEGTGHPVLLMHGASLGSSADVFRRNPWPRRRAGLHAIAFDFPGYGLSEVGKRPGRSPISAMPCRNLIDALGLKRPALIAHSPRSGSIACSARALEGAGPVLASSSYLGPAPCCRRFPPTSKAAMRKWRSASTGRWPRGEPTRADTQKLMEADVFHTDLVNRKMSWHSATAASVGRAFETFTARANA